jgi:hypothetical protein
MLKNTASDRISHCYNLIGSIKHAHRMLSCVSYTAPRNIKSNNGTIWVGELDISTATPVKKINHLKLFLQKKTASAKALSGCLIEVMLKDCWWKSITKLCQIDLKGIRSPIMSHLQTTQNHKSQKWQSKGWKKSMTQGWLVLHAILNWKWLFLCWASIAQLKNSNS